MNDPAYWCGRLDRALGENLKQRPIGGIALCFAFGALVGLMVPRGE